MRTHLLALIAGCGVQPDAAGPGHGVHGAGAGRGEDTAEAGGAADTAGEDGSDLLPPERRVCEAFTASVLETHEGLMGEITEAQARLALPGPGLGVGDVNGDGHLDVVLARPGAPALLWEGDGTGHLHRSERVLPVGDTVALGLLNKDDHLDIVLAGIGEDVSLLSQPDGSFRVAPLPQAGRHTTSVTLFDADGDGDLDLFAPRHRWPADLELLEAEGWDGDGHALLLNDGTGHFSVDRRSLGAISRSLAFQGAAVDVDLDGDLDLYINNDFGPWTHPNGTLENDGTGGFSLRSGDGAELAMFGMGTSVADPSGDGWPDLLVSNIGNLALLQSMGDGTFVEAAAAHNLVEFHDGQHIASWGSRFVDLDGDGADDLALGYSTVPNAAPERSPGEVPGSGGAETERDRGQRDLLLLRDPAAGGFVSASAAGNAVTAFEGLHGTKAVVTADLDADGRPELLKVGYSVDFDDLVLRSYTLTGGCGPGITLRFPLDARHIGATVVATVDGQTTTRWMLPATTYGGSAPEVYVGLGAAGWAEHLQITDQTGEVTDLSGAAAGAVLRLGSPAE